MPTYPHMCRDDHMEIGHADSEHETCPLCRERERADAAEERASELLAKLWAIESSALKMTMHEEWYAGGIRKPPGEFVLMKIGPATSEDVTF